MLKKLLFAPILTLNRQKKSNFAVEINSLPIISIRFEIMKIYPPVVKYLLLLNLVVFVLQLAIVSITGYGALYYFESPYFYPFQLVTYMFMHADFMHIFFNMFALWMFGRFIEQAWGSKRFLIYYMLCGIGAGLAQEIGQATGLISPYGSTIGASGAVFGVLLAFGMTFPEEKLFIIPFPFPIKAKWFVLIYAAIELLEGMHSSDNVAHYAHLGGMVVGLFLILYWKLQAKKKRKAQGGGYWSTTTTTSGYDKGGKESVWSRLQKSFGSKKQPKVKMHISYENGGGQNRKDYEYNARKAADSAEIDRILDKIRKGGYSSLTAEEKKRLFDASNK